MFTDAAPGLVGLPVEAAGARVVVVEAAVEPPLEQPARSPTVTPAARRARPVRLIGGLLGRLGQWSVLSFRPWARRSRRTPSFARARRIRVVERGVRAGPQSLASWPAPPRVDICGPAGAAGDPYPPG